MDAQSFFAELDAEDNELVVRERLAAGRYNTRRSALAQEWLRRREHAKAEAAATRGEAREEDAITIARDANTIALAAAVSASDANDIARSARKTAWIAAIAAIVAAIAAIKWR